MALACGSVCQPKEVQREIELFPSSTRPARVATDAGEGFIKALGNPQGPAALISELVAGELCAWFGLKIPPFAVIEQCAIEIPFLNGVGNFMPPLFFSRAVDGAATRDGSDLFLKKLTDPWDVAKLVVFDTWVKNSDRYHAGEANPDNLLYVPIGRKYDLVPIDHTHCFVEIEFDGNPPTLEAIRDPTIFGRFPEFEPYLNGKSVKAALQKLATLDSAFVGDIVNSVPQQWGLDAQSRQSLVELICRRAEYVLESLEAKLVAQASIPGLWLT